MPLTLLQHLLLEEAGLEELGEVEEAPVVALVVEEEEEQQRQRQEVRTQGVQLLQQQDLLHKFCSMSILSRYETYLPAVAHISTGGLGSCLKSCLPLLFLFLNNFLH